MSPPLHMIGFKVVISPGPALLAAFWPMAAGKRRLHIGYRLSGAGNLRMADVSLSIPKCLWGAEDRKWQAERAAKE